MLSQGRAMALRASNKPRTVAAVVAAVVPACFNPVYDQPVCGPRGACPDGTTCMAPENACVSKNAHSFASTELAAGQLANMTIDARGALTPTGYNYGGLVAFGLQDMALWRSGATDWSAVTGATPTGAGLWRGEPIASTDDLDYLGVSNKVILTIWLEGEVWLEASAPETFSLQANGVGFLELASPGAAAYVRLVDSTGNVAGTNAAPFLPPATGWYPIRIAFSDSDNQGKLALLHSDAGGPLIAWTRDRLRVRASELAGTLRTVFFQQMLGGGDGAVPPVAHFENADLLPPTSFATVPQGTERDVDWSARYFGQVYIEQAGNYTLTITSDDGNRGRLGAMTGISHWGRDAASADAVTHVTSTLRAGWNDLPRSPMRASSTPPS